MLVLFALACGTPDDPASAITAPPTPEPAIHTGDLEETADTGVLVDTDPPDPPPCVDDAMEDNDDLDHAVPWTDQSLVVFSDDPDYWQFELQPGQSRRVELAFDHTYGNIDLTVYNELSIAVGSSYSFSDDEAVEVTNTSGVPTTARIRVLLRDPGCNTYTVAVRPIGTGEG